jgi:hypothetical protein
VTPTEYLTARTDDLVALLPAAREWMVDIPTVLHMAGLGFELGHELARRGMDLAAWTMRDQGRDTTAPLARRLLALGTTTIIADEPHVIAGYLSS